MKNSIIFTSAIALALSNQLVSAGSIVGPDFVQGETLTADIMNNIKTAVNDNATDIESLQTIKSVAESAQVDGFSSVVLTTTNLTTVHSVTITVPSNGIVLVSFSASARLIHPSKDINNIEQLSRLEYTILADETDTIIPQSRQIISLPVTSGAGAFDLSMSSIRTFTVSSQGQHTFYVRAVVPNHPSVGVGIFHTVLNPTMQAVFIPQ